MAFNPNNGIPAPLKTWQKILNDRNKILNNSPTKNGACTSVNFPFGLKTFAIDYSKTPMLYGAMVSKLTTTGIDFSYIDALNLQHYDFRPNYSSSSEFLASDSSTNASLPLYNPVVYAIVDKVSVTPYTHYSDFIRACYYRGDTNSWDYVSGVKFKMTGKPDMTDNLTYYDVHDISEIADWYVLSGFTVYDTGADGVLPRKKISNSINFIINFPAVTGVNSFNDSYMNMAVDSLIPLPYYLGTTGNSSYECLPPRGQANAVNLSVIGGSGIYELISNMTICDEIVQYKLGGSTYVQMYDGFNSAGFGEIGQYFNTKCVMLHNHNNGDKPTSSEMPQSNKTISYNMRKLNENELISVFHLTDIKRFSGTVIFKSLDDITAMFADLGLKVVFSETEALNTPGDIINPDTIPSGFDTNFMPTIDSFPDNNTDDFFIDKGVNPSSMAVNANIFNQANIYNLLDWFTTGDFVDTMSRLFSDPLSAIFSIRYYPFDIVQHDRTGVEEVTNIKIVNVSNPNISGYQFLQGYNTVINGGELYYTAYYGNFADWACTKYDLYLPYLGIVNISPSMVVNKSLRVFYNVDFITGNAQIFVKSYDSKYNKSGDNGQLVYTTMQKITIDIPITYTNFNEQNIYNATSALRAVTAISNGATSGATSGAAGGVGGAIAGGVLGGIGAAANSAIDYVTNYPRTEYGAKGDIGVGMLSPQDAYLLITRKILAIPANGYGNISGNPSAFYGLLKSASGYVRATSAKCDGIPATNSEINEIMSLLSAGIYI